MRFNIKPHHVMSNIMSFAYTLPSLTICHITCPENSMYRPEPANAKKKNRPSRTHWKRCKTNGKQRFLPVQEKNKPGNLTVIQNPSKSIGKTTFSVPRKEGAREGNAGTPAPTTGISPMPYGNHWKNNGFRTSVKVERGWFSGPPLGGMGNLTVIRNPLKSIGKTWFPRGVCNGGS